MAKKPGSVDPSQWSSFVPGGSEPMVENTRDVEKEKAKTKAVNPLAETTEENKAALARVVALQSGSLTVSPTHEDAELAVPALWSQEKTTAEGQTVVATSISEEAAITAVNMRFPNAPPIVFPPPPGEEIPPVTVLEALSKPFGGGLMPNRVGNELTTLINRVNTDDLLQHRAMINVALDRIAEKCTVEEVKKDIKLIRESFLLR